MRPCTKSRRGAGDRDAKTSSREFTVKSAEYTNDVEVWSLGDKPRVKVVLEAADGYRFSYTTSSHFRLSGRGADFIKARIYDSGSTLNLECYLSQVDGKTGKIQGLDWIGFRARWDKAEEDVKHYSGENTVTERQVSNNGNGSWIQNQHGWWYRYYDGGYPSNTWEKINNTWYYFNRNGYMLNGWQQISGSWYYLGGNGAMTRGWQSVDGRWYYINGDGVMLTGWQYLGGRWYYLDGSGAMLTGWQFINGRWYFLDGSGAMLTGWQFINGAWYYLDSSGAMYADQTTPDGYYVDGNGKRT